MNFSKRVYDAELMDDFDCKGEVVDQTLHELEVINRLLGGDKVTLSGVEKLAERRPGLLHITDIGCGGGDMALKLIRRGRKRGYKWKVTGIDANPHIVAYARKHCQHEPYADFRTMDIFSYEFSTLSTDIVVATLFFHHFTEQQLIDIFTQLKSIARVGIVINDLHRHPLAYHSISVLTKLFSRSPMVRNDGPLSVRRAFRRKELESILKAAGITDYTLSWKWAFRWKLVIRC